MGWFSDRFGKEERPSNGPTRAAAELAVRLNRQRAEWLEAVAAECRDAEAVLGEEWTAAPDSVAASGVASAFQAVHVLSLAHANSYVAANDIGQFTTALCEHLTYGRVIDRWKNAVHHYTKLKIRSLEEQLLNFSEEIAISLSGSPPAGMVLAPGLVPLSNAFLLRNLEIASQFFGLEAPMRDTADAVRTMPDDQPAADMVPLPEWLEEKATDAPTLFRVVMDALDLRFQRDHPTVLACSEWKQFRKFGTIGGCVALSLRLHVDVPQAYRTPLEHAVRASLELGFPGSEVLYEDCVRFVREALLETERPKRHSASLVLVAMWVFGAMGGTDSLHADPELVAALAHAYQNEVDGYWVSAA